MNISADTSSLLIRQRRSVDIFACTVVISLLLHCTVSTVFLLPGRYSLPARNLMFVDLKSLALPSVPPEAAPVDEAAEETPAAPEVPPLPVANTESARLERAVENSLQRAAEAPEAVHESAIGLGMLSGHFASFAQGETLKDDIRVYYFELMRRINEIWWTVGAPKGRFTSPAAVNLSISRDGRVLGCELLQSSGSREQDQALLDAIKKAEPLPPLPQSFPQRTFTAPLRFAPPLSLMFPAFGKKPALPH